MARHTASGSALAFLIAVNTASAFAPTLRPPLRHLKLRRERGWERVRGMRELTAQLPDAAHAHMLVAQATEALSRSEAVRYFFAGGMCCGLSSGATVPIDVVKTRMQTDPHLQTLSVPDAARHIVTEEGSSALFTGLGSTLMGFTINGAVKYGLYEVFKPFATDILPEAPQFIAFMLAAAFAEVFASALLCPLEATRIRLVTEPTFGKEVFDALPRLWREQGIGILRGLPAILIKMVPGTVCQMASYELLTRSAYAAVAQLHLENDASCSVIIASGCALLASIVSTVTSQPGDTILSEINKAGGKFSSISQVVKNIGAPQVRLHKVARTHVQTSAHLCTSREVS